jgi:hypothetical protein
MVREKDEKKEEYKEISLFTSPIQTLKTITVIVSEQLIRFIKYMFSHKLLMILFVVYIVLNLFDGPHKSVK